MKSLYVKIVVIITLFVITVSLLSYKSKNNSTSATPPTEAPTTKTSLSAEDQFDREEGTRVLRSFIVTYNSYRWGDISNVTSLYPVMCDKLATSEKAKAATLQEKFASFDEYITVESQDTQSELMSYDKNKIVARVTIQKTTLGGGFVPDSDKTEGSYKILDRSGKEYMGSKNDLIEGTVTETYEVTGIKESSDWKVCEIQKINT